MEGQMPTEFQFSWDEMVLENPQGYEKILGRVIAALVWTDDSNHDDCRPDYRNMAVAALKAIWEEEDEE